jgi:serine/threonine protein kinase
VSAHGPLGHDLLYGLATGLAEALDAIHAAGVIHRDLKPANVLLTKSGPKVIDFGIAQALDSTVITEPGVAIGSLAFMAPEQLAGKAGQAADIFAWGLTVGFAAKGEHVHGTAPADVIVYRILHDSPDLAAIPASLRPIVEAALTKDPGNRPAATAILQQFTGQPDGEAGTPTQTVLARNWLLPASAVPDAPSTVAPKSRRKYVLALSSAALVAIAGGAGAALLNGGASTHTAASGTGTSGTVVSTPTSQETVTATKSAPAPRSSPSQTLPTLSQPGASPFRSSAITDQASAFDYVAGFGYGSRGLHYPSWDSSAQLNAVVAFYNGGVASGPGKVFLFANGKYVGSDTPDGSISVGAVRVSSTEIEVQYLLYKPGEANCCPTGGTVNVRFTWTGTKLVALDPIPSVSQRR